ncbi:MAG: S41 family peptidase [Candidatus Nealsonbacteria bacterium]|nr:S41 family peptidase [Candidatus Nealsonbacteria bacterium]
MSLTKKVFLIGIVLAVFGAGFWFGRNSVVCPVCPPEELDFSLFWEAWHKIERKYIEQENIKTQDLIYGAISGMVRSLGDPYTTFFKPEETKMFLEDVSGRFEGIGIEIDVREGQLQVITPLEGTPAQKAGLRPGDKIIKIDERVTADITIEEAVTLIRGPKGTEVNLMIVRDGWDTPRDFKIKRGVIEIPSFKWELKDDDIAYIKLYHFSEKINYDFSNAAIDILKSPAKKIILDLRSNPGGYLQRSQDIAGWFLEKSDIVVIEDFGGKQEQKIYKANGNAKFLGYPMVILINQGTASASEILASALQENRGIKLIGETSFGKGSVQELERLTEGSSLKITIGKWLTPKGNLIAEKGLEPDIKVEITDEDYEQGRDPQLDKALEIIREMD